ncbi:MULTISPECIES: pheST operon leader peptide PheM [Enterobacterales]|uniref:pheST attenuator peptide n=2 Tax=Enterobacterales TaxID=91347 RepID=A0A6I6EM98_9GAMM|nr:MULTISPECIES: pheST operon leader peptide PheM [Enterobacterales]MTD26115.1 pheST operon leader peptide PheM [Erwinia sorbitola]QGU89678.1 pheST operon leader peptide PheM [Erwinia sorbitola]QPQ25852.1 pheST operon leader peptide PheM [Lonsdalea populi]ROH77325.1 pheST operon leader peptide PheM [Lonsdalea populi]ROH78642.1 pheST operon leader peptide PheM [Lonsdalea populi]
MKTAIFRFFFYFSA